MEEEIIRAEWEEFLGSFAKKHKDWLVTVTRDGSDIIKHQPLKQLSISAEGISITAGEERMLINAPQSIRLIRNKEGADQSINCVSENAISTIRIDRPTLPEMVDGILI